MRVISAKMLRDFWKGGHAEAKKPLLKTEEDYEEALSMIDC